MYVFKIETAEVHIKTDSPISPSEYYIGQH